MEQVGTLFVGHFRRYANKFMNWIHVHDQFNAKPVRPATIRVPTQSNFKEMKKCSFLGSTHVIDEQFI